MIAIIDYGVGNIFSLYHSFKRIGADVELTGDTDKIKQSEKIILPGVGAFRDAANILREMGLADLIKDEASKGKPILGICLGMQLLFDKSFEYGETKGLGLIEGCVRPISDRIPKGLKIPQIGWNSLSYPNKNALFEKTPEGSFVYFVHSYFADTPRENIIAETEYGAPLTAAVARGNVYGVQFHPEKSGDVGLGILKAFCERT